MLRRGKDYSVTRTKQLPSPPPSLRGGALSIGAIEEIKFSDIFPPPAIPGADKQWSGLTGEARRSSSENVRATLARPDLIQPGGRAA